MKFWNYISWAGKYITLAAIILIAVSVCAAGPFTASAADNGELLAPGYGFSTNYYRGYGEPDINFSIIGDPEFERGETAMLKINLVNRGVLYGFKADKKVGTNDNKAHELSLRELEYEARRTTAIGLNAKLESGTDYIEIDPGTSSHNIEKLVPGELPEDPLEFRIRISNNAPAGEYILSIPISYKYQNQARMTNSQTALIGLPDLDHTTHYRNVNKTLYVPIQIKESPKFEITQIEGSEKLYPGSSKTISVTYKNIGETTAEDAVLRTVSIIPLSTERSTIYLGTMQPGEERTVTFDVLAQSDAVGKGYNINSEIRYLDTDNELRFSDDLKIGIEVEPAGKRISPGLLALIGIIILVIYLIFSVIKNIDHYK